MAQHRDINHTGLTGVSTVSYASNANQTSTANYGGAATTVSRGDHIHLSTGGSGNVATDAIWTTAGKVAVATGTATATEQWPPGHEFDYAEKTSDTNITATTEGTADTIVTANAVTYDGSTAIYVEACGAMQGPAISSPGMQVYLYDGASSIGIIASFAGPGVLSATITAIKIPFSTRVRLTPSAASHTYSLRAITSSGTALAKAGTGGAGTLPPFYIRQYKA